MFEPQPLPLTYECSPETYGHVISPGHTYCHCNSLIVRKEDPWQYEETRDYMQSKIVEGLYRGESLSEIMKVAVVQAMHMDPALEKYIDDYEKREREERGEALMSKYAVCHGCRRVYDIDELRCKKCHDGIHPMEDFKA